MWVLCSQLVPAAQGTLSHCRAAAATFPAAQLQRRSAAAFRGNCSEGLEGAGAGIPNLPPPSLPPPHLSLLPNIPPSGRRSFPDLGILYLGLAKVKGKHGRKNSVWGEKTQNMEKAKYFCEVDWCLVFAALAPIPQHSCWFLQVTLHTPRKPA